VVNERERTGKTTKKERKKLTGGFFRGFNSGKRENSGVTRGGASTKEKLN